MRCVALHGANHAFGVLPVTGSRSGMQHRSLHVTSCSSSAPSLNLIPSFILALTASRFPNIVRNRLCDARTNNALFERQTSLCAARKIERERRETTGYESEKGPSCRHMRRHLSVGRARVRLAGRESESERERRATTGYEPFERAREKEVGICLTESLWDS